ncbi:DUF58 domain-containing protein, partial [Bacteriovoracaceae bacterium]|nr:DUF58 domain-containing protein [Bacteriovoracaceae bacterium]
MLLKKVREFLDRRERIFIIPTSYGLYYLSIIFILFLISLSYGHSLAFSTTFIFVSIILVSAYYTNYNLSGLTVSKVIQKYESSDLKFKTYIQIKNDANKVRFDIEGKVLNLSSLKSTTIGQRDTDSIYIDFSQLKPGLYHLDKVRINTSFPFGLFRSWKNFKTDAEIIVLPSISNSVAMINTFTNSLNSKKEEVKREGVDDFEGHSAYRFGDSWKNIDWKAYSRQHGLVKKEYTENFK